MPNKFFYFKCALFNRSPKPFEARLRFNNITLNRLFDQLEIIALLPDLPKRQLAESVLSSL